MINSIGKLKQILTLVCLSFMINIQAQQDVVIEYDYDANGNRTQRKVLFLLVKPAPEDTVKTEEAELEEIVETEETDSTSLDTGNDLSTQNDQLAETSEEESSNDTNTNAPAAETSKETNKEAITALAEQIQVYPNPTRGAVSVHMKNEELAVQMFLHNANGKLITQQTLTPLSTKHLNLRNHPNGNYYLKLISTTGQTETITIVKTE
jgi:hypothetical protein